MTKKTDNPIGPTEEQFVAFAKAVIDVERAGHEDSQTPKPLGGVRVASLADLKVGSWGEKRTGQGAAGQGRTALFCLND